MSNTQGRLVAASSLAAWADLPLPLWEAIAALLPTADLQSLRQAWRGASRLAHVRLCEEACAALEDELSGCVTGAVASVFMTATEGMVAMAVDFGEIDLGFLCQYMDRCAGALALASGARIERVEACDYLEDRPGRRLTYELNAPHAGVAMQVRGTGLCAGGMPVLRVPVHVAKSPGLHVIDGCLHTPPVQLSARICCRSVALSCPHAVFER